jgi:hypothetical protein
MKNRRSILTPRTFFKSCRAQAWGFDLLIASAIFIAGITVFYVYSLNYPTEGQDTIGELFNEGNFITNSLLTPGAPEDWDEDTVIRIGILTDNKVDEVKLEKLYLLANWTNNPTGYARSKSLFNIRHEYFFNFTDDITLPTEGSIPGIGFWPETEPVNLIKVSRLTIYNNKPSTLNLYVWE